MMLCDKFGQHIPLNRQVERFAFEGVPISLSTAADAIGACCQVLDPLVRRIESHTFASERIHGDDTTVPVLALGKTVTGRIWSYVKDDAAAKRCTHPIGGGFRWPLRARNTLNINAKRPSRGLQACSLVY